ncbi:MAG: 16S rRNA (uracil(1498)-N(3))-methyltransferase [Elusimicrobia bacterium]|nr:16S rRNA (uracil(1498)-N(3))-methyltransferase [Elusimicrobiota bacterium]
MPQFFLPADSEQNGKFHLRGPEAFHISRVLRYREGDPLVLFDGKGTRFEAVIGVIHPDGSVSGTIVSRKLETAESVAARLNLYQGLLKSSHWEWLLQKGTEIGVSSFIPVTTPRTVVLLREEERVKAKRERWAKIVLAAAKQCGRADLPAVAEPVEFRDAIKASCGEAALDDGTPAPPSPDRRITLVAWEGLAGATARRSVRDALLEAEVGEDRHGVTVDLFVGPEGGFSDEEIELAESMGAVVFGLGRSTLRGETAAIAAASLILYEFGAL